jgi:hypothetical protein
MKLYSSSWIFSGLYIDCNVARMIVKYSSTYWIFPGLLYTLICNVGKVMLPVKKDFSSDHIINNKLKSYFEFSKPES